MNSAKQSVMQLRARRGVKRPCEARKDMNFGMGFKHLGVKNGGEAQTMETQPSL